MEKNAFLRKIINPSSFYSNIAKNCFRKIFFRKLESQTCAILVCENCRIVVLQAAPCDGVTYNINIGNTTQEAEGNFLPLFHD